MRLRLETKAVKATCFQEFTSNLCTTSKGKSDILLLHASEWVFEKTSELSLYSCDLHVWTESSCCYIVKVYKNVYIYNAYIYQGDSYE